MVEVTDLTKKFGNHVVFRDANFKMEDCSICGIVGKNGSGKSIFLKILSGLVYPTKGKIIINGKKLKKGCFPEDIGVVLDCTGFLTDLSGIDNLKLIASIKNEVNEKQIVQVLQSVGLDPGERKTVGKYSVGMRQKLGIAQAIMESPRLLLLDEALNGMDDQSVRSVINLLKKIREEKGTSIIFVSHDRKQVEELCDAVWVIQNEQIIDESNSVS